jgi:hypothetical protein
MNYNDEFFEEFKENVRNEAISIASELDEHGDSQILTVEVKGEFFEFAVECTTHDYKVERETNTVSYRAEIFCYEISDHENAAVTDFMKLNFLHQVIYVG